VAVTLDDIAAAFKARFAASPRFAAAVPGGGWLDGFTPDTPDAYPYAVLTLTTTGVEYRSDRAELIDVKADLAAYCPVGAAGVDPGAVQLAMSDAVDANPTAWPPLPAGEVLHGLPLGYDGKAAADRREGRDVLVVAGHWRLKVFADPPG